MPHYDYKCLSCGHIHEETRSVAELDSNAQCDLCGATAKYHFNPIHVQGYIEGGPTHKWDSSNPFLPKRVDADGRPQPFETYGALKSYKDEHGLIDAFDDSLDADSSVRRYDDETPAMEAFRHRIDSQDEQLAKFDALPANRKIVGEAIVTTVDDGDVTTV